MKPGALVLVAMVDPGAMPATFRRKRLEWPLHVTVAPWFTVPDESKFIQFLENHLQSEQGFEAVMGEDAAFGASGEIPVTLVQNRQPFGLLHNYVLEAIYDHGGEMLVNTWIRENYRPHVTHHGANRLFPGDVFMVQSLTLVRLLDEDLCEVVTSFSLGAGK